MRKVLAKLAVVNLFIVSLFCFCQEPILYKARGLDRTYDNMSEFQKRSDDLLKGQENRAIEFSFMTINAGMLNAWYSAVPEYKRRSPLFPEMLTAKINKLIFCCGSKSCEPGHRD